MNINEMIKQMDDEKLVEAFDNYVTEAVLEKDATKKRYLNGVANLIKKELVERLGGK